MNRKGLLIYVIFSILFFFALTLLFFLRLNSIRDNAIDKALLRFDALSANTEEVFQREAGFASNTFSSEVKSAFRKDPRLLVLAVYSYDSGIAYLSARDASMVEDEYRKYVNGKIGRAPDFATNNLSQLKASSALKSPQGEAYFIQAVYEVLGRNDVFPLLRDSLIIITAFVFVTGLLILINSFSFRKKSVIFPKRKYDPFFEEETAAYEAHPQTKEEAVQPESRPPESPGSPAPSKASPQSRTINGTETGPSSISLFSRETGLSYREYLEKRLTLELERAAYNEQDLCIVLIRFPGIRRSEARYSRCASFILDYYPFPDLAFEYSDNSFCLILNNVDLDQGIRQMEDLERQSGDLVKQEDIPEPCFGLSSRNGRLVDGSRLIIEAKQALERTNNKSPIVGFRSDPAKYRKYIAEQRK